MNPEKVLEAIEELIKEKSKLTDGEGYIIELDLTGLSNLIDSYTSLYKTVRGD